MSEVCAELSCRPVAGTAQVCVSLTVYPHLQVAPDAADQVGRGLVRGALGGGGLVSAHLQQQHLVQHHLTQLRRELRHQLQARREQLPRMAKVLRRTTATRAISRAGNMVGTWIFFYSSLKIYVYILHQPAAFCVRYPDRATSKVQLY